MGFASHNGLWLALFIVPLCLAGGALLHYRPGLRKFSSLTPVDFVSKAVLALFLCLTIARPYLEHTSQTSETIVLVDISESMDELTAQELLNNAHALEKSAGLFSYLPFSASAAAIRLESNQSRSFNRLKDGWSRLNIGQSNLEHAVRSALAQHPSSLLVISDGQETAGNIEETLPLLKAAHIPVFPLVPAGALSQQQQFRISNLYAPLVAPLQKSVDVRVSVANTTGQAQRGTLEVFHENKQILKTEVEVLPGQEALFIAPSDPSQEGIHEITARLIPAAKDFSTNLARIFLSSESREKVLLLSGAEEDRRVLDPLLQNQSYQLTSQVAGVKLASVPRLSDFSAVVLNNISAGQLPSGAAAELQQFVSQGGGLIMLGGSRSFGLGGYIGTDIEKVLPVELVPPRTEKKRLNVAVELVIDKSRSMAENQKLEYSKEAAREVIRNLKDDDFIGVIGFDESPFEVVRMGRVGELRQFAAERVGRLYPEKRTNLFPSMSEARHRLEAVDAGRKHMIILTDGKIPDGNQSYVEMVKQMRYVGITVSTVLIGSEFDFGFLRSLAEYGGGAYYQTDNPNNLPRIFVQDVKVQSGERTMREQEEFPVRPGTGTLQSTSIEAFPVLRGFVETKQKSGANLELVIMSEGKAYPLLASGTFGQGKVLAFTSDANGRWSSYWTGWPKFATFCTDILDAVRPDKGENQAAIKFDLRPFVERGALTLDLSIFSEQEGGKISAALAQPDGTSRTIEFSPLSRGHFQSVLEQAQAGRYELRAQAGARALTPVAFYISGELFGEKKGQGFDLPRLEQLASASAGHINPNPGDLKAAVSAKTEQIDLSIYFLSIAALLLCLDVLRREVLWRYRRVDVKVGE